MPPVEGDSEAFTAENDEETAKYMNVDEDTVMDAKTANRNLAAEIAALLAEGEDEDEEGVGEEMVAPLAPLRRRRSKVAEEGDMNDRRSSCFLTEIDDHDDDLAEVSKQEGKPSIVDFYLKKQASEEDEGNNLEEPSVISALCPATGTEDTATEFPVNGVEDIHERYEEALISQEDSCNLETGDSNVVSELEYSIKEDDDTIVITNLEMRDEEIAQDVSNNEGETNTSKVDYSPSPEHQESNESEAMDDGVKKIEVSEEDASDERQISSVQQETLPKMEKEEAIEVNSETENAIISNEDNAEVLVKITNGTPAGGSNEESEEPGRNEEYEEQENLTEVGVEEQFNVTKNENVQNKDDVCFSDTEGDPNSKEEEDGEMKERDDIPQEYETENISVIIENESAQLTETEYDEENDKISMEKENTESIKITQPPTNIVQVSTDAMSNCNDKIEEAMNLAVSHEDKLVAGHKESSDIFPEGYPELLTTALIIFIALLFTSC